MFLGTPTSDLLVGRMTLCTWKPVEEVYAIMPVIGERLALHGPLQLAVKWAEPEPKLQLLSKIGFIHVVWIGIAQLLSNEWGPFQCDDCSRWFFREGEGSRGPKRGSDSSMQRAAKMAGGASG